MEAMVFGDDPQLSTKSGSNSGNRKYWVKGSRLQRMVELLLNSVVAFEVEPQMRVDNSKGSDSSKYQLKGTRLHRVIKVMIGGFLVLTTLFVLYTPLHGINAFGGGVDNSATARIGNIKDRETGLTKTLNMLTAGNDNSTNDKKKIRKVPLKYDENGSQRRKKKRDIIDKLLSEGVALGDPIDSVDAADSPNPAIGYIRRPKIPKGELTGDDGLLHIIFSTSCNYFQHWQSEMLLATAKRVGQRGRITRIVSGCHNKDLENGDHTFQTFPRGKLDVSVPLHLLNRSVNDDFGLYITPSFEGAIDFPWINKPSSIRYFMEHGLGELKKHGETIVAILDPDFVFLKPLTQVNTDPSEIIASRKQDTFEGINTPIDRVKRGRPVAQRYGLEGLWVNMFDIAEITGDPKSPAIDWDIQQARRFTSVGPPLMLHVDDLLPLSKLWADYMPRVLHRDHDILADMWAYSIAAAHLGLKHTQLDHYMVSSYGRHGEGYMFIDAWKEIDCANPVAGPDDKVPVFVHMASSFRAPHRKRGPWIFHKSHVPSDILSCASPLHVSPPKNLWAITDDWKAKQQAWVLCHTIKNLNDVAMMNKQKFCPHGFEQRKLVRHVDQSHDKCDVMKDKWCYPLATIETLKPGWRTLDEGYKKTYIDDIFKRIN